MMKKITEKWGSTAWSLVISSMLVATSFGAVVGDVVFASAYNVKSVNPTNDPNYLITNGNNVEWLGQASWIRFDAFNFGAGVTSCTIKAASGNAFPVDPNNPNLTLGGVKICLGSATAPSGVVIANIRVSGTGSWSNYLSFTTNSINASVIGTQNVYFQFYGTNSFNIQSFQFEKSDVGVSVNATKFDSESHPLVSDPITKETNFLSYVALDSWVKYSAFDFGLDNLASVTVEGASPSGGGLVKLFIDGPPASTGGGTQIGSVNISATGGWTTFLPFTSASTIDDRATGVHDLYLVFSGGYNIKSFKLNTAAANSGWTGLTYDGNKAGLENNPLKGFVDIYGPTNAFPRSINGKIFKFTDVVKGLNNHDWAVVDQFISANVTEGNYSYIQFNIDPGLSNEINLPIYLDAPVVPRFNVLTPQSPGGNLTLDWNDEDLMQAMLNFITAFGLKYKNEPKVFMIHQGLYGMFGEWHIGDVVNDPTYKYLEMNAVNKARLADAYSAAFPGKKTLLARFPQHMPSPKKYGYSDGLFFGNSIDPAVADDFLNILTWGGADTNWQQHPMGGEVAPALQPTIWESWPTTVGDNFTDTINLIHPTFLISHEVFSAFVSGSEWNNAIKAQKAMGYTFYAKGYKLTSASGKPTVKVNIQNKGVAPLYADWMVDVVAVKSGTTAIVPLGTVQWYLSALLPNNRSTSLNNRSMTSTTTLTTGTYAIALRIVNPMDALSPVKKPVTFANTTWNTTGTLGGYLTLGNITIP